MSELTNDQIKEYIHKRIKYLEIEMSKGHGGYTQIVELEKVLYFLEYGIIEFDKYEVNIL